MSSLLEGFLMLLSLFSFTGWYVVQHLLTIRVSTRSLSAGHRRTHREQDSHHQEVVNSLNRMQMTDQPPQVNDHIVLTEQVCGVSPACQHLLSAP